VEQRAQPLAQIHWLSEQLNPHGLAAQRPNPYTRYTFMSIARCFLEYGDSEFTRDTAESLASARSHYLAARGLLDLPELVTMPSFAGPGLTNPVLTALRDRVANQLRKLRLGRNIAGMKRQVEIYTPSVGSLAGMPTVGPGSPLIIPGRTTFRPTPYGFSILLDRAKQLASVAQQMEATYLTALERQDAAHYDRLRAGFNLQIRPPAKSSSSCESERQPKARSSLAGRRSAPTSRRRPTRSGSRRGPTSGSAS
jgi:hypothetical protein